MELEPSDAAASLGMPKSTLFRWVRQGKLPCREVDGRLLFPRRQLESWARRHDLPFHRAVRPPASAAAPPPVRLCEAMSRGGVRFAVRAGDTHEALASAVAACALPPRVDRAALLAQLVERERLSSTGLGGGVAVPHPRRPLPGLHEPRVTTCFLERGVDFDALDGAPVRVLFLMLSPSTKVHLGLLARLGFLLRDPQFCEFLLGCGSAEALLRRVRAAEAELERS